MTLMNDTLEMHLVIPHGTELPSDDDLVVELTCNEPDPPFRRSYVWNLREGDKRLDWYKEKAISTWGVMKNIPYRMVIP